MTGSWQRCTCSTDRSKFFVKYRRDESLIILECGKCSKRSVFSDFDRTIRMDDKLRLMRVHKILEKEESWMLDTKKMRKNQTENIRIKILDELKKNPQGLQYGELLDCITCRPTTLSVGLSHMQRKNLVYRESKYGRWKYTGIKYEIVKNKIKISFKPLPSERLLKVENKKSL